MQCERVLTKFRARFLGKVSPVHFFWGSFDLAVTRFSRRTAPPSTATAPHTANWVMREAYSHEVSSVGFWPGDASFPMPAFYAYAYPTPSGLADRAIRPVTAFWKGELGEFLLPYAAVREAPDPDSAVQRFLHSTFDAAAALLDWPQGLVIGDVPSFGTPPNA